MRKAACICGKTNHDRLVTQILSSIDKREVGMDTIDKLLDELDALFPAGNVPVDLEQSRHELRGATPAKHSR